MNMLMQAVIYSNSIGNLILFCLILSNLTIREVFNITHLTIILQFKTIYVCSFDEKHC